MKITKAIIYKLDLGQSAIDWAISNGLLEDVGSKFYKIKCDFEGNLCWSKNML